MPDAGAFGSGLVTGLREGVEAALIVSIVIAYLAKTGNADRTPAIWLGTGLAAVASLVLGIAIFVTVGSLRPPYDQLFEAGTMLIAAAIVTGMLFWMRRQAGAISGSLRGRVERVLGEGGVLSLAVLAFSSVIREGIETAIFLVAQVTAARDTSGGSLSVLGGAVIGLAAAAVLGVGFYHGSRRLNLARFFRWTGIGLVFIAAGLLSRAVHELVEINAISIGTHPVFDVSAVLSDERGLGAFLRAIVGYSSAPEATVLGIYLVYVVAVLALYLRPVGARILPVFRRDGGARAA